MFVGWGSWWVLGKRPKSEGARPREKDGLRESPFGRRVESARRLVLTWGCPGLPIGLLRESPAGGTLERAGQQLVDQSRHRHSAAFALMVEGADEKSGDFGLVAGRLCHQPHMPRKWGWLHPQWSRSHGRDCSFLRSRLRFVRSGGPNLQAVLDHRTFGVLNWILTRDLDRFSSDEHNYKN